MSSVTGLSSRAVSPNFVLTPPRIASPGLEQSVTPESLLPSWNKGHDAAFKRASEDDI